MRKIIITKVGAPEIDMETTALARSSSVCFRIPINY
jgi:hypothetical protein